MSPRRTSLTRRVVVQGALVATGSAVATGCATDAPDVRPGRATPSESPSTEERSAGPRVLVAFFSRAGENYYYGDRTDLQVGNTAVVAQLIDEALTDEPGRVELHEILAADPYPDAYDATVTRNSREQDDDVRPAIAGSLPDPSRYDVLLLGSGIWNVRPPMIMSTFVESVDLSGVRVHPFVTYAVSGLGRAESVYADALPDAELGEALAVQGEEAAEARAEVVAWLERIGLRRAAGR